MPHDPDAAAREAAARAAARAAQAQGGVPPVPGAPAAQQGQPLHTAQQPRAGQAVPQQAVTQAQRPSAAPVGNRVGMNNEVREGDLDLNAALRRMLQLGGSDLHLTVGAPPMARVDGGLVPLEGFDIQKPESLQRVLYSVLSQRQRATFPEALELDSAYSLVAEVRLLVIPSHQRD